MLGSDGAEQRYILLHSLQKGHPVSRCKFKPNTGTNLVGDGSFSHILAMFYDVPTTNKFAIWASDGENDSGILFTMMRLAKIRLGKNMQKLSKGFSITHGSKLMRV